MMQDLLADRFHLKLHKESKEIAIESLVVAKNGPEAEEGHIRPAAGCA